MANPPLPLFALPGDNVAPNATVTCPTQDADYPAQNAADRNPARPFKSTTPDAVLTFTFTGDQVLKAIAIFNHTLAGRTCVLANGNGLSVNVPVAANDHDGICLHAWARFDHLAQATRTDDVWTLTIPTGTINAAIGEVLLSTGIRDLNLRYGLRLVPDRNFVRHTTFGGARLHYDKRIRSRRATGMVNLYEDEVDLRRLEGEAHGPVNPFLFIPDDSANDAWLVQFVPGTFGYGPTNLGISEMPFSVEETSMGPPLFTP